MWILGRCGGASLKVDLPPGAYLVPRHYDAGRLAALARLLADAAPKARDAVVMTWKHADTLEALGPIRGDGHRADALWALHGDAGAPLPTGSVDLKSSIASRFPCMRPRWVLVLDPEAPASTQGWLEAHVKMHLVSWLGRLLGDDGHPLHASAVERIDVQALGRVTSDPLEMIEIVEAAVEHRLTYAFPAGLGEDVAPERVNVEALDWERSIRVAAAHRLARRVNGISAARRGDAARLLFGVEVAAKRRESAIDALVRAGIVVPPTSSHDGRLALARSVLGDEDGRIVFRDGLELSGDDWKALVDATPRAPLEGGMVPTTVSGSANRAAIPPEEMPKRYEELRQAAQTRGVTPAALAAFAGALQETDGDPALSKSLFERAIASAPNDANVLGNYALSLSKGRDLDGAQALYERAIAADPKHANNLGNYASFLWQKRWDLDRAQEMYERAIAADPKQANILSNYATFLWEETRDPDRAQELYDRTIALDPKHANNLGNYASFLRLKRRDLDRAQELFERAITADPKHANNLGRYALFLWEEQRDLDRAQELHERAMAADPKNAIILGNYANFLRAERHEIDRAQELYVRAIAADPKNAIILANFAHLLFLTGRRPAAVERLREAIRQAAAAPAPSPPALAAELAFYRAVHLPEERDDALRALHTLIAQGASSPGWDFRAHALLAEKAADADAPLLFALADVLSGKADPSTLAAFPRWTQTTP